MLQIELVAIQSFPNPFGTLQIELHLVNTVNYNCSIYQMGSFLEFGTDNLLLSQIKLNILVLSIIFIITREYPSPLNPFDFKSSLKTEI